MTLQMDLSYPVVKAVELWTLLFGTGTMEIVLGSKMKLKPCCNLSNLKKMTDSTSTVIIYHKSE